MSQWISNFKFYSTSTILLISFLITGQTTFAAISSNENSRIGSKLQEFHPEPSFYTDANIGENLSGKFEFLLPIKSYSDSLYYGIIEAKAANSTKCGWMLGLGSGYRTVTNNHILGGYLLLNSNGSPNNHYFFTLNPGIEKLSDGTSWDWYFNGYVALNNKLWLDKEDWADNFGIYKYIDYSRAPHSKYDHRLGLYEESSSGVEITTGHPLPLIPNLKAYASSYYFHTRDLGNITGIAAKLSYQLNQHTSLELANCYDNNRHNIVTGSVKLAIGGFNQAEKKTFGIFGRITDPIEHGIATNNLGYSIPLKEKYVDHGVSLLEQDHIWFFKSLPPSNNPDKFIPAGDGTYEHPFYSIDSSTISVIRNDSQGKDYANLYFAGPGGFNLENFPSKTWSVDRNYSIYGKTNDFLAPAAGPSRPTFIGSMNLSGNNILSSISFLNAAGEQSYGISITPTTINDPIILDNITIGTPNHSTLDNYLNAISIDKANNVSIKNSNIFAYNENVNLGSAIGLSLSDSVVWLENNIIDVSNSITPTSPALKQNAEMCSSKGIQATSSVVNLGSNNTIKSTSDFNSTIYPNYVQSFGIDLSESSHLNIFGDNNHVLANAHQTSNTQYVISFGVDSNDSNVDIYGNHNSIESSLTNSQSFAKEVFISSGINLIDGTLNILGNNNLIYSKIDPLSNGNIISTALWASNTNVNISGNFNTFISSAFAKDNAAAETRGINLTSGNLSIAGNYNSIIATSSATKTDMDGYIDAIGIKGYAMLYGSTITIAGNNNFILAQSAGFTPGGREISRDGISLVGTELKILGNNNKIQVHGGSSNAAGIYTNYERPNEPVDYYNSIKISGVGNEIEVDSDAGDNSVYGIYGVGHLDIDINNATFRIGEKNNASTAMGILISDTNFSSINIANSSFNIRSTNKDNEWGIFSWKGFPDILYHKLAFESGNLFYSANSVNKS